MNTPRQFVVMFALGFILISAPSGLLLAETPSQDKEATNYGSLGGNGYPGGSGYGGSGGLVGVPSDNTYNCNGKDGRYSGEGSCSHLVNYGKAFFGYEPVIASFGSYHEYGNLEMCIGSTGSMVNVAGNMSIEPEATLTLEDTDELFDPAIGDTFTVVTCSGLLRGEYQYLTWPTSPEVDGVWQAVHAVVDEEGTDSYIQVTLVDNTVPVHDNEQPQQYALESIHPNPFNPMTTLTYALPRSSAVEFRIFDVSGRQVWSHLNGGLMEAGQHTLTWTGVDNMAGGRFLPVPTCCRCGPMDSKT